MPHGDVRRRANPRRWSFRKLAIGARKTQDPPRWMQSGIRNLLLLLLLISLIGSHLFIKLHPSMRTLCIRGPRDQPSSGARGEVRAGLSAPSQLFVLHINQLISSVLAACRHVCPPSHPCAGQPPGCHPRAERQAAGSFRLQV